MNGLKGEDLQGGIALWGYAGQEAYFSNVRFLPAKPEALANDGEAAGDWRVKFTSDYGKFEGAMSLKRSANLVSGTWSGAFGQNLPVTGTWRNGYVELNFGGMWKDEKPDPMNATLAGWIDGDSAGGRMKVEGRADGQWTATRTR